MTHIERARLKPGRIIRRDDKVFSYHGFAYKAHILREFHKHAIVTFPNGHKESYPVYEYLSNQEILNAMVEGTT